MCHWYIQPLSTIVLCNLDEIYFTWVYQLGAGLYPLWPCTNAFELTVEYYYFRRMIYTYINYYDRFISC